MTRTTRRPSAVAGPLTVGAPGRRGGRGHDPPALVRIHATGWPSTTRSPRTASHRTRIPSNGVRTSVRPTVPDLVAHRQPGAGLGARAAAGRRGGLGQRRALQGGEVGGGLEHAGRRADDDPFGRVEVLALPVRARRAPLVAAGQRCP